MASSAVECLVHAWWIDSLLYLLVCAAVVRYALPLARGIMMCYKIANSVMDMIALQSALATAKPVKGGVPGMPVQESSSSKEAPRGVMRRPVVKPIGSD